MHNICSGRFAQKQFCVRKACNTNNVGDARIYLEAAMQKLFFVIWFAVLALASLATPASTAERNFTPVSFSQSNAKIGERLVIVSHSAKKGPVYAQALCPPVNGAACGQYCCYFNQLNQYGCCKDVAHCCSDGCCE
jgi:hypothetical protein